MFDYEIIMIEEVKTFNAHSTGNSVNKQKAGELIASLKKLSPDIKEQKRRQYMLSGSHLYSVCTRSEISHIEYVASEETKI